MSGPTSISQDSAHHLKTMALAAELACHCRGRKTVEVVRATANVYGVLAEFLALLPDFAGVHLF